MMQTKELIHLAKEALNELDKVETRGLLNIYHMNNAMLNINEMAMQLKEMDKQAAEVEV